MHAPNDQTIQKEMQRKKRRKKHIPLKILR